MKCNYYLTGPDGVGKTTFLRNIEETLNKNGHETQHIWLRSPKITSKPLMGICRLTNLTKYFYKNNIRYGSHEFYRSRSVSLLFPILQLLDFRISMSFKYNEIAPGKSILFDRFSLDTLADLMVDTHRFNIHKTWIGKKFIDFIPKDTKILVLLANEDIIRKRKQDTQYDPNLSKKIEVYKIISKDLGLDVIYNNNSINEVKHKIFDTLEL